MRLFDTIPFDGVPAQPSAHGDYHGENMPHRGAVQELFAGASDVTYDLDKNY